MFNLTPTISVLEVLYALVAVYGDYESDHTGAYQVRAVTHVINAADHYMDIELRRNALGKE